MTSPAPSGGPSRRRVAGLALVGVGVIAAIIGLASLALDGGGGSQTAAPPPGGDSITTAPPAPGGESATAAPPAPTVPVAVPTFTTPTAAAPPPVTEAAPPPAPAPGGEQGGAGSGGGTDASGGSGGGGGAGSGVNRGPVRVYNNSTITGLAASAAGDLRNAGWEVGEVANYPFGIIRTTTVYYRPGTAEKGVAEELGREFDMRVSERFEGLQDASPGVIVIVTNDYKNL